MILPVGVPPDWSLIVGKVSIAVLPTKTPWLNESKVKKVNYIAPFVVLGYFISNGDAPIPMPIPRKFSFNTEVC